MTTSSAQGGATAGGRDGAEEIGGRPETNPTFRDRVHDRLVEAFRAPQELHTESGKVYRWVLRRDSGLHAHVYLTLDSPELPTLAHVMVSDPGSIAVKPISSRTMRTMEEVEALITTIRAQLARTR
jgi:hypothetical protein